MKIEVLYRAGERGGTVCLVRRSDRASLYLRWYEGGRPVYTSLEHGDPDDGKDAADDAAKILRRGGRPGQKAAPLTLAELLTAHATAKHSPRPAPGGVTLPPEKSARQIASDKHRAALFLLFFTPARAAETIDADAMGGYVAWRRAQGVSDTTIGHETTYLKGVYEWGRKKRSTSGARLLEENPIEGVRRLRSAEPYTPVASDRDFRAVYRYADRVDAQKLLRPLLMLVREHGWRLGAWCQMRVSDFDLRASAHAPYGRIRKRSQNDKKGKGGWKPLTPRSRRAVRLLLRRRAAIGEALAFPAPRAEGGWQDQHALEKLHEAEALATEAAQRRDREAPPVVLGGFHALRRKWGSDRKDLPLVDVAEAGDWAPQTLLAHYTKADPGTTLRVTLNARKGNG